MRNLFTELFIKAWLFLEKFIEIIKIPSIKPNNKTLFALKLLKKIYASSEKQEILLWVTGSWAITGRNGNFFKNINDIDFTMRKKEDEKRLSDLLKKLGLKRDKDSPMGANCFFDKKTGVKIDFGSTTYPKTIYYQIPLRKNEKVSINNFSFRVIPIRSHLKIYKDILFNKGRNIKGDLIKIKILSHFC